jgi:hypothetical protein
MRFIQYSIFVCIVAFVAACNQNKAGEDINPGYDFFPLEKGRYVIYDIENIVHNVIGTTDTFNYQIKEVIGDTISATDKSPFSYQLLRYKRTKNTDSWMLDSVWSIWRNANVLVKNENGEKFIKLSFPLKNAQKWNGNAYNNRDDDTYEVRLLGNRQYVNGLFYDNTVTIMQNDSLPLNYVNRDYRVEYYAKNIGLIYKEWQIYTYDQATLGQFNIETGSHYIQQISSYGKE